MARPHRLLCFRTPGRFLPIHGRADGQRDDQPADVSHGRDGREEEIHRRQTRPALRQAAAFQREADGKRLQVQGHRRPEAGRLHSHPAVHKVVREQLSQPRGERRPWGRSGPPASQGLRGLVPALVRPFSSPIPTPGCFTRRWKPGQCGRPAPRYT